ncbi:hypothetical protein [Cobetia sp. L2A1]|uniref:hypothetical protein n=1 Tax=Cobetia sp. L2A1 TaxID=2686360 RepID=UPI00131E9405|nr:hypothetical protein [Cobetia sp. L2A1]
MIGEIKTFDDDRQEGIIVDEKGAEHVFDLVGWRGRGLPGSGLSVDFELRDGRAMQVFNARVKQQKARRKIPVESLPSASHTESSTSTFVRSLSRLGSPWLAGALTVLLLITLAGLWLLCDAPTH